jgi:hypothetical protein
MTARNIDSRRKIRKRPTHVPGEALNSVHASPGT